MIKIRTIAILMSIAVGLSGCSALGTAVQNRNLEVKNQMTDTIWLDPAPAKEHTVYVQVRNTTDKQVNLVPELTKKLEAKGYKVMSDPAKAHYWLQVNILKLQKMDPNKAEGIFHSGYGSALGGAAVGALAMAATTSNTNSILSGGLIGGAVSWTADQLVKDVNYTMITDVQVVVKTNHDVKTTEVANIKNGSSSDLNTTLTTSEHKLRYQTRIMSNANKVNLAFKTAKPALVNGLTTSLAGIF